MTLDRFAVDGFDYTPIKVHILNRYWLDRPDYSGLADPGAGATVRPLLSLPRPLAYLVQALANALPSTAMMMMIGVAYALVYGLVGRINLAFGSCRGRRIRHGNRGRPADRSPASAARASESHSPVRSASC